MGRVATLSSSDSETRRRAGRGRAAGRRFRAHPRRGRCTLAKVHTRRLASLILGAWLGGSVFMIVVASRNFAIVEEVLATENRQAAIQIELLSPEGARMFLRHLAGEMNRYFFQLWGKSQIALGALLFLTLIFATNGHRYVLALTALMVGLAAVMHFRLTPEIVGIGRAIDYVPIEHASPDRIEFQKYHRLYVVLELSKLAVGALLGAWLLVNSRAGEGTLRRRRSRRELKIGDQVEAVDDADHSHVDR
jgi:hypothetical protein